MRGEIRQFDTKVGPNSDQYIIFPSGGIDNWIGTVRLSALCANDLRALDAHHPEEGVMSFHVVRTFTLERQ